MSQKRPGHIRPRGKNSWELKFDTGRDPGTGRRTTKYKSVKGGIRDAQRELNRILNEIEDGAFVAPTKETLADAATHWLENVAPVKAGQRTLERYQIIIKNNLIPALGNIRLTGLQAAQIETLYANLRASGRQDGGGGLSEQSIIHIHRVLSQIITWAIKKKKLKHNPLDAVDNKPQKPKAEIQILEDDELGILLNYLSGRALYLPTLLAASTGMRRGEVLGLRWADIDIERGRLQVTQTVEQTKKYGIRFKPPKTRAGRRLITLSTVLLDELRRHKREQAQQRLALGLGKDENDLVVPTFDGKVRSPTSFTKDFRRTAEAAGTPHVTFHGLRHTHISALLREGIPITTVSKRAGHENPAITLSTYAHVMGGMDEQAAVKVDEIMNRILGAR